MILVIANTWEILGFSIQGTSKLRPLGASIRMNGDGTKVVTVGTIYRLTPFTDRHKGVTLVI